MADSAESEEIFRRVALDRLSSPEQLDRLVTLTSPIGWAAVATLATLIVAVVAWGVLGSIPTRASGAGIIVSRAGQVFDAMAPAAGTLISVAAIGTEVRQGDVVARFDGTQADQDVRHAKTVLREKEDELAEQIQRFEREIEARQRLDAQQRASLTRTIAAADQRHAFYADSLRAQQSLAQSGFITRRSVQDIRQLAEAAEQEERTARNELLRIDSEALDQLNRRDNELARRREAANDARRSLEEVSNRADRTIRVVSPIAGQVTEVKANIGSVVAAGRSIVSIETAGQGLELVLYLSPDKGKRVYAGMEVRVEPATVKKEEFGTLLGHVLEVSQFPATPEGMLGVLQNPQLVARFTAQGAPYAARAALVSDAAAPSGYKWSTGNGPPIKLSSGTIATAEVTVRKQSPISLVLPILRERTGI